jgi:hypothetical protein
VYQSDQKLTPNAGNHEDLEQVRQPSIAHKSINQIKANCAHHDDDQEGISIGSPPNLV